jgi:hypothetical protein
MARGGKRVGAGRPKGARNRKTTLKLVLPRLEAADVASPLYELLARISDPALDDRYRDMLRIAVMPFVHPRPRADMPIKPLHMCTDEELTQLRDAETTHRRQIELAKAGRHLRLVKGSSR